MTDHSSTHNIVDKDVNNAEKEVVMRGKQRLGLFLMLMFVTACTPVVYDATRHERRSPSHVVVRSTYSQPSHQLKPAYRQVHPIEVTLYADNTYLGVYFKPIHLVIADGEYVSIPIKNRRGRQTAIYAHYHQRSFHFDADRNCRNLHVSSRYKYDKRWDKGHKYTYINAGKDYDLTGIKLQIRNVSTGKHKAKKNGFNKVINRNVIVHNNNSKTQTKQHVNKVLIKNISKKPVIRDQRLQSNYRSEKDPDYYAKNKLVKKSAKTHLSAQKRSVKVSLSGGKVILNGKRVKYLKTSLVLKEGESRRVTLVARGGLKVSVPISYRNGILKLKSSGGQFRSDPSWVKGKTYKIQTNGSSRLDDVRLTVIAL